MKSKSGRYRLRFYKFELENQLKLAPMTKSVMYVKYKIFTDLKPTVTHYFRSANNKIIFLHIFRGSKHVFFIIQILIPLNN